MGFVAKRRTFHAAGTAEDLFVSAVSAIEVIGCGMVRATFVVNFTDDVGRLEAKAAEFAVVIPLTMLPDAIGKAMMALGRTVIARENEIVVRH